MTALRSLGSVCLALVCLSLIQSCDSGAPAPRGGVGQDPTSRGYWVQQWAALESSGHLPDRCVQRIRGLVKEFESSEFRIGPRLLDAVWGLDRESNMYVLTVMYYDETGTLAGFCVREYDKNGTLLVEERYPVYPKGTAGLLYASDITVPFLPRAPGKCKDEEAWHSYEAKAEPSRDSLPEIWITPPGQDRRIEVSLIDTRGNHTSALELCPLSRSDGEAVGIQASCTATRPEGTEHLPVQELVPGGSPTSPSNEPGPAGRQRR